MDSFREKLPKLGSSLKRKGRTVDSILKLFRLTTVAKGTSQSGSRKLRSSGKGNAL
jgi:hypothetical protein